MLRLQACPQAAQPVAKRLLQAPHRFQALLHADDIGNCRAMLQEMGKMALLHMVLVAGRRRTWLKGAVRAGQRLWCVVTVAGGVRLSMGSCLLS